MLVAWVIQMEMKDIEDVWLSVIDWELRAVVVVESTASWCEQ